MVLSFNLSSVSTRLAILLLAVALVAGCSSPEQKAQNYYERGMGFLSKKDYVKASIEFKNALQLKQDLIGAWRGLLEVETHNRSVQNQVPILRTIVELDPKDVEAKLKLGGFLLAGNALNQALDLANAAIELDGRNARALALRGAVLLQLKDTTAAKHDAEAALEIDPTNAEALIVLAGERAARGDYDGALLVLDRQGATNEMNLGIQAFKLFLFVKSGNLKQAEALLRKLSELYPQEREIRMQLVRLYLDEKRTDDAEKELRAIAAANPSDMVAGLNVVRFVQQVKGPAAAREELLARTKAGVDAFKYQIALAEFDFEQGRQDDGIQLLEKLIKDARSREDAVAAQVQLANIKFSLRKFDVVKALVTDILRNDARNIDGIKLRAQVLMEQGQLDPAIADLRQALNDKPQSNELMVLLAAAYERSGSIELAEKQYADATKVSGFEPTVGLSYAAFLRRRGNAERAEDILTQLAGRWPSNIPVLTTLADVRLERQNWKGAQAVAETIQRIGDTGRGDQIIAAALSGQGKYADSIKILEGQRAAAPTALQPVANLVSTLVRAQKLDEAVSLLQTVLKENPTNADALVLLGSVQLMKNAPDEAIQNFRTAIERQPKNMAGYQALADFYIRNKNLNEAEKAIRAGVQQQPDGFAIHMSLASVLELKGDYEAAIAEYEELLKKQPGSMAVANNLATLLAEHRSDAASLERAYSIAAMLRKSPTPFFKDTLGWIDYLRGDNKNALLLLEEAAAALPNEALIRYHLGMVYAAAGEMAKASGQIKKAAELVPADSDLDAKIKAAQKKMGM